MMLLEKLKPEFRDGQKMILHRCTFCNYPCGYRVHGTVLWYDNGCDCSWHGENPREWSDLEDTFERNPHLRERWLNGEDER